MSIRSGNRTTRFKQEGMKTGIYRTAISMLSMNAAVERASVEEEDKNQEDNGSTRSPGPSQQGRRSARGEDSAANSTEYRERACDPGDLVATLVLAGRINCLLCPKSASSACLCLPLPASAKSAKSASTGSTVHSPQSTVHSPQSTVHSPHAVAKDLAARALAVHNSPEALGASTQWTHWTSRKPGSLEAWAAASWPVCAPNFERFCTLNFVVHRKVRSQ
jgi:hypothetical protein